jgi:hypothetical protein
VVPAFFPDEYGVHVYDTEGGPTLVAAVELVSPRNKDRPVARKAFAAKCAAYLQRGVGLVVVDIVTTRRAKLHDELMGLLRHSAPLNLPGKSPLSAVAYRPARRDSREEIDVWPARLAVGEALPVLPLALRGVGCVRLDLEGSYAEARQRSLL